MSVEKSSDSEVTKNGLHPRNPHRFGYDFDALTTTLPALKEFIFKNKYDSISIDFSNPDAVKTLNSGLLKHFYNLDYWDIPKKYLVPPVPGRADYIHYAADLMAGDNVGIIPQGATIKVLDIGVGSSLIYPIIGHKEYGWNFIGVDIDHKALQSAQKIIDANKSLNMAVTLRHQKNDAHVLQGAFAEDDEIDLLMCNPPFHATAEELYGAAERKWNNLNPQKNAPIPTLNFGGQSAELITHGGEQGFVMTMIKESLAYARKCYWFTSLISKETTLRPVYRALKKVNALEVRKIEMSQGQKKSRFIAWTFLNENEQRNWRERHWWR